MAAWRQHLVDLLRQWPWIFPRGEEPSLQAWVQRAQERRGWYAGLRGDWYEPLHPEGILLNPPPADLPDWARGQFHDVASRRYPPAAVAHLSGANIIGDSGMVLTTDNRVLTEFSHHFADRRRRRAFEGLSLRPKRLDAPVALLAAPEARNHYHWLFDVLPRLHLLARWRPVIERYAVPAGLSPAQRDSLQLLGIRADQLLELHPGERIRCQHLYLPSLPGSEGCYAPWARAFLQSAFTTAAAGTRGAGERLLVRRGPRAPRPVRNEAELIASLTPLGFTVVALEEHSLLEQIAIFRDARIIVAAHGAGLANLIFARRAALLELFSRDYLRPDCYFTLARQMGLRYDCWIDPRPPGSGQPWGEIQADLPAIVRKIELLARAEDAAPSP